MKPAFQLEETGAGAKILHLQPLREAEPFLEGLNADQEAAFRKVASRVLSGERITKLVGYAGTGKTFLLARIARYLSRLGYLVTVAAPTHKAVGVIQEKLGDPDIQTATIHSLLGLRLERDLSNDTGGRILKAKSDADITGVVICDEGSMVGEVLKFHIEKKERVRWIFVGDNAQLPPVGEETSTLLEDPDAVLSTVVRQKGDSQILDLATEIRSGNRSALKAVPMGRDVIRVRDADALFEAAYERFVSSEYAEDCAHARVLVFRNKTRQEINERMRKLIVGSPLPYTAGEWLVMYEPFSSPGELQGDGAQRCFTIKEIMERLQKLDDLAEKARYHAEKTGSKSLWQDFFRYRDEQQYVQLRTSQELRIEAVYEDVADIGAEWFPRLEIYTLTLRSGEQVYRSVPVLKPHERMRFQATLAAQRAAAVEQASIRDLRGKDSKEGQAAEILRKQAWQRFYLLSEMFATTDYAFAMTTHKSQGSTFDHAFVDVADLMTSPQNTRQRLLYTAVTRPSKTLTFYF